MKQGKINMFMPSKVEGVNFKKSKHLYFLNSNKGLRLPNQVYRANVITKENNRYLRSKDLISETK